MVKSIEKVCTFFIVIVLFLLLLQLLGGFIASSMPEASDRISEILHSIWLGFQNLVHYHQYR